jgi:PAS domain S-box-containing protein
MQSRKGTLPKPSMILKGYGTARFFGFLPIAFGIAGFIGWATKTEALIKGASHWAAMSPWSAVGLTAMGLSLLFFSSIQEQTEKGLPIPKFQTTLYILLSLFVQSLGAINLAEYVLSADFGIDLLLFKNLVLTNKFIIHPGRITQATSLSFFLMGLAVLVGRSERLIWNRISSFATLAVTILSFLACLGYLFGAESMYHFGPYISMAFYSAIGLLSASISLVFIRKSHTPMSHFFENSAPAITLRSLLPFVILAPIGIGSICLHSQLREYSDPNLSMAIMILASILVSSLAIWVGSKQAILRDAAYKEKEKEMKAVLESQYFLNNLLDHFPTSIIVKDIEHLRCVYVNEQAETLIGLPRNAIIDKTAYDLVSYPEADLISEKEREAARDPSRTLSFDQTIHTRTGAHPLRTWKVPVQNKNGDLVLLMSISQDLTDLKQAEAEREIFFTTSLDMCCVVSMEGYFKRVNPVCKEILGYTPEEMCATSFFAFLHPDDIDASVRAIKRQYQGEKLTSFENRFRTKGGQYRWLSWHSVMIDRTMYGVARDVY